MFMSRKRGRSRDAGGAWPRFLLLGALALPLLGAACAQRPIAGGEAGGTSSQEPARLPPWPARGPVMVAGLG